MCTLRRALCNGVYMCGFLLYCNGLKAHPALKAGLASLFTCSEQEISGSLGAAAGGWVGGGEIVGGFLPLRLHTKAWMLVLQGGFILNKGSIHPWTVW
jgi:hypothetical protein